MTNKCRFRWILDAISKETDTHFLRVLFFKKIFFEKYLLKVFLQIKKPTRKIRVFSEELIVPPKNIPCFDAHKEWPHRNNCMRFSNIIYFISIVFQI